MRLRTRSDIAAGIALTDNYARTEPAWHDAPTVPGLWVCVDKLNGALTYTVTQDNLTRLHNAGDRWFGPIPEDKP